MAYSTVQYGSSGNDVKKLQEVLNTKGYSLDVDGQFGSKTQAAVRDYQKKNNLAVDGIVGTNTWGSLTAPKNTKTSTNKKTTSTKKSNTPTSTLTGVSSSTQKALQNSQKGYTPAQSVLEAQKAYKETQANKPEAYASPYDSMIKDAFDKIMNREKFSYNLNGDAMYQQLRDVYMQNGKKAMMDTVGQVSSLTGGYGSSYATTAGSQAYHEQLNQLNSIGMDLYDRAYQRYSDEGDDMYTQLALMQQLDDTAYGRYRDDVGDWQSEADRAYNIYANEREFDYGSWQNHLDNIMSLASLEMDNYQFEKQFGLSKEQFEYQKQKDALDRAAATAKKSSGSSSGYSSSGAKPKSNSNDVTKYNSSWYQAYGENRFSNPGTLFSDTEYQNFIKTCSMYRGNEGRAQMIEDAVVEGKISDSQGTELLKKYNISDDDFSKYRGLN